MCVGEAASLFVEFSVNCHNAREYTTNLDINRKSNINRLSSLSLWFQNGENNDIEIRGRLVCMEKLNRVSRYYPASSPRATPFPPLRLFHLTTVDSMPSYHTVHSPIAQVNRPVIRALPKYRNRADNAFNIFARYPTWIWTAAKSIRFSLVGERTACYVGNTRVNKRALFRGLRRWMFENTHDEDKYLSI